MYRRRRNTYLLAGEEHQHVAIDRLTHVQLEHGADRRLQVVALRLRRVEDLDRMRAAGDAHQRRAVEVRLRRRTGEDDRLASDGGRRFLRTILC